MDSSMGWDGYFRVTEYGKRPLFRVSAFWYTFVTRTQDRTGSKSLLDGLGETNS